MDWIVGSQTTQIAAGISDRAQEYNETVSALLSRNGIEVTSMIHAGSPASVIEDEAMREPEAILAMSTHGHSGINRWILGSTAEKVLHTGAGPLFLIRTNLTAGEGSEAPPKLQSVIVPLDGSEVAEQVLPYVVFLGKALGLKVYLVRATLPTEDAYRDFGYPVAPYGDMARDLDSQAENYFNRLIEDLRSQGLKEVELKILHGHPAEEIVDFTKEIPNTLVAMASHGRSGIGRWVLGSVVDRVIRNVESPMLLVRATPQ